MIFIDANQYLDLYRLKDSKTILPTIDERRRDIFVTVQVVDEVNRRKLALVENFLKNELTPKLQPKGDLPEQLLSSDAINRLRACKDAKSVKEEFAKLIPDLLKQVSQSTDVVSKALENLFSNPVEHKAEELERARLRQERGNPPGKKSGPIGDQLNWEQILTRWRPDMVYG